MTLFATDFFDHVGGQSGLDIFDVVQRWLDESFADRTVDHRATMFDADRDMGTRRMVDMSVTDFLA
jgi:hypothetical protein